MGTRVALNHKTRYRYGKPVWLSPHVVRLRPAPHCRTSVVSYSLKVTPAEHFINWQQDPYSNRLARLVFPKKSDELCVEVDLVADLTVTNPFDFFLDEYAEVYPFQYDEILTKELSPYFQALSPGPLLQELVNQVRKENVRTIDYLVELNQVVQHRVKYLIRVEPGIQTPEETLTLGSGSCRDSAWLLVQLLRQLGLGARFVSGYLIQLAPDIKPLDGPQGPDIDVTDLHAWAEVYLPGAGWVGFDPTSGLLASEGHIPLACSADPVAAAAITGFFSDDDQSVVEAEPGAVNGNGIKVEDKFEFSMSISRIHEDPRVTKPYTDEQWAEIESLGHKVDADLKAEDVRLTMGGEPTFVAVDDMDGEEWNTTALGPEKYKRANTLLRRLRCRFAPNGLLHYGQGKWYPGEPLPRWTLGLYWRKDGEPIWRNPALVADENEGGSLSASDAQAFITALAERLDVNPAHALAAYEDVWYYMWKERRLPINVDPFESKLKDKMERARLAGVFESGLDKVTGYALPLRREHFDDETSKWESGAWFFRSERMYLLPGDSPMGLRLPLDSIPWVKESEYPHLYEQDPMAERPDLPDRASLSNRQDLASLLDRASQSTRQDRTRVSEPGYPQGFAHQELEPEHSPRRPRQEIHAGDLPSTSGDRARVSDPAHRHEFVRPEFGPEDAPRRLRQETHAADLPPVLGESAPWVVRTALCTEVRDGVLRIFMPPQRYLEDFLELIAAIEDTAAHLNIPVLVEGYAPPKDPRIYTIKVTPDPGVIEVNTQPVESWEELVRNTTVLYEEARLSRLGTEKFMLDGRHTGTGGGNHIVIGGPSPADSPLLFRPALLRSLVGYWHNHPALSYLFSGLFVGPTSQAPRVDEARNDQIYELEIAFKQIPEGVDVPPWTVDRIFRNLLVDATGNTHRAEFCIDKLYSPESASGRLGLLELRAFEMPPHARMSLAQHLLLRALIAKFWKQPYREPLVRWRTEIHDRFLLPYFVRQDMEDVVRDLEHAGYDFKLEWLAPQFEFRFPTYGTVEYNGIELELRQAIEPWNVLGEESGAGGTVRYVDSSVEKVQVLVNGMVDPRHVVTCNGQRVPLHPTGTNGQFVAGVRYRAWQPANCLHPTIPVHAPLVFDILDTWSGGSIGGCTYHVAHPGGRSYDRFPVNAHEAEGRRASRFFKFGHTPGPMSTDPEKISKEFPFTLDLRAI